MLTRMLTRMFTGPVGPVYVFFHWPEALFGDFYRFTVSVEPWPALEFVLLVFYLGVSKFINPGG